MSNLNRIVYLSEAEYQTLIDNGTITKGGRTITYSANDIYITPEMGPLDEYSTINTFPVIGKSGHIYVALDTNTLYRWDGIEYIEISGSPVQDVQVNGVSVLSNGVANIPKADGYTFGAVKVVASNGIYSSGGTLQINKANSEQIKEGIATFHPIVPYNEYEATFYGLAKAAGADMKDIASTTVGVYPDTQKIAIRAMLDAASPSIINIQASQPSTVDTKIWIDNDADSIIQVPTVTELNTSITTAISDTIAIQPTAPSNINNKIWIDTDTDTVQLPTIADMNSKADKTDTVLETTLSRGRMANTTVGEGSFAFGLAVEASGSYSTSFGTGIASGFLSFSLGNTTVASGASSVAMGSRSVASGMAAHAEGIDTTASGNYSYAEGIGTIAARAYQHVQGKFNIADSNGTYSLIIGNGAYDTPSNAYALTWTGDGKYAGDVYVGCNSDSTGGTKVATLTDISTKVDKVALDDAGISARTYTELFGGEFSVTTATTSGYNSPYARASVTGRISKHYTHRVTVNGTEYVLRTRLWYSASNGNIKVYEYLGNLGLYLSSTSGMPGGTDNVPFVIISDLNNSSSIDVLTSTAGTYTIKVEQIGKTQEELPKSLIWEDDYVPIEKSNNGGTYNGFSIGVNELINTRGTVAFGYGNRIENEFGFALGEANILKCSSSYVEGSGNEITGFNSMAHSNHVEGYLNKFTNLGICNHIEGMSNTSNQIVSNIHVEGASNTINGSGTVVHIEGVSNISNGASSSHIEGVYNIANGSNMHIQGAYNVADTKHSNWVANTSYNVGDYIYKTYVDSSTPYGPFICITSNSDSTFDVSKWKKIPGTSDTAMLIGNGTADNARSNALKIDWLGNARFNGNVYVGCNADSTGGTRLPHDVQVNGTSVVSDGVANVPVASDNDFGVIKTNTNYGTQIAYGNLATVGASGSDIQAGTNGYKIIAPKTQHSATFYGLAKAAGDTTQSTSSNAVGAYTDSAKASIKSMLGIIDGSTGTVTVTGTTPTITAVENTRYVCGEVATLTITPPASGICIVRFTSGTTPTVLTASGVIWPEWFDDTDLEAEQVYEICITDGYGAVMSWAQ